MANSVGLHEADSALQTETKDVHRALTSMQEELEAADWYAQRVDAASDAELKAILGHNRDEEIEHFMMLLEWWRRRNAKVAFEVGQRLETSGSIVAAEQASKGEAPAADGDTGSGGSLGIGSLKGGSSL
jgi:hypothetical protein